MVHPVGSHYTNISRCTVHKTLYLMDLSLQLKQHSYILLLSVSVYPLSNMFSCPVSVTSFMLYPTSDVLLE
jgi:hypothetical protein